MPTSRATRVTSAANAFSWSTIVLIVSASSATSPFACTVILRERSPFATAVVTSAMLRTWLVRLSAMPFTDSVRPRHTPETPSTCAGRRACLRCRPRGRRASPRAANDESWSTIVLIVSLQREELADRLDVDLLREVALRDRGRHVCDVAHLIGQVPHHQVHVVGQAAPDAARRPAPRPGRRAGPRRRPRGRRA